jgi:hypothetical protein
VTRISKPMRGRRPTKRLDLTDMKEALRSREQWTALGVVIAGEGGKPHYEVLDGADIHVEVELQPMREKVFARLAAGMWVVPSIGEEVAVIVPAGDITFMPTIVCILASSIPATQGPTPERIVITRQEVAIHDGSGGAAALPTMDAVAAIAAAIEGATITPGDGGASLKATILAGLASSLHGVSGTDTWPTGTTVLKAK